MATSEKSGPSKCQLTEGCIGDTDHLTEDCVVPRVLIDASGPTARVYPRWPFWFRLLLVVAAGWIVFAFWALPIVLMGWWSP